MALEKGGGYWAGGAGKPAQPSSTGDSDNGSSDSAEPSDNGSSDSAEPSKPKRRSSSSEKTIVIYDSSGKITQSNDPNRPVGTVDPSKAKESVLTQEQDTSGKSVVFKRSGGTITKQVFGSGGMESSEVVQDSSTSKGNRKTTSQLAKEQAFLLLNVVIL